MYENDPEWLKSIIASAAAIIGIAVLAGIVIASVFGPLVMLIGWVS